MVYFEDESSVSEKSRRSKSKSRDFLKAISEADSDLKMTKLLSGIPTSINNSNIMSVDEELRLIRESTQINKCDPDANETLQNELNKTVPLDNQPSPKPETTTPSDERTRRSSTRLSVQVDQIGLRKLGSSIYFTSASKSPKKPITELEKQRREINKLKGKRLDECLSKHMEVVILDLRSGKMF